MKASERIARRYFLDVRGAEDTPALAELIEPLAELLAECGVDQAFELAETMHKASRRVPVRVGIMAKADGMAGTAMSKLGAIG